MRNWNAVPCFSFVLFLIFSLALASCNQKDTAHAPDTYTCPMHPTVISDKPGSCPVCGMDLVRKARPSEEVAITEDLTTMLKSPNETVLSSIQTIKGQYKYVQVSFKAQGVVTYDTRNLYTIPSRVAGRLEKVYFKYQFQSVVKGQKIAEIYSPEVVTAQRELLFLLDNDAGNKPLIDAAKYKLERLGLSPLHVTTLMKTHRVSNTVTIYSPYSGYVISGQQSASSSASSPTSAMSNGMRPSNLQDAVSTSQGNTTAALIREGDYISAGQTLVGIVNTAAIRVELDLPSSDASNVKKGDTLNINVGEKNEKEALVDFVQPFYTEGQPFVKVRVSLKNSKELHIGHLVNATINFTSKEALWIPSRAVLDLGSDKIVFVKDRGAFKPSKVNVGISAAGELEIKNGLSSTDEIAANAQYLMDSESFIKIK
jgi:multidrug efflux pump subunit AcrA (membrane-fusion protein)